MTPVDQLSGASLSAAWLSEVRGVRVYESYDALEEARGSKSWGDFAGEDGVAYLSSGGAFLRWYNSEDESVTTQTFLPHLPTVWAYVLQYMREVWGDSHGWILDGCYAKGLDWIATVVSDPAWAYEEIATARDSCLGTAAMRASLEWIRAQRGSESDGTA